MKKYIISIIMFVLLLMVGQPDIVLSGGNAIGGHQKVHGRSNWFKEIGQLDADEEDWWWVENLGNPYEGCNSNGAPSWRETYQQSSPGS